VRPCGRVKEKSRRCRLFFVGALRSTQLFLQQAEHAARGIRGVDTALATEHAHPRPVALALDTQSILAPTLRRFVAAAPEGKARQETPVRTAVVRVGVDIAHEVKTLRPIAVFHR
ncbi:hypothetical protein RZS08_55640, partial [Arthrospira platensis SPKY1]|nr:hypothetical protein [Arthrospira platensis SPKY1]